jgi:histone H3/H4
MESSTPSQEEKWERLRVRCPPLDALVTMQLRNVRRAQIESNHRSFFAGPFDALLVGTCGVQAWSAPLVRLLSADARKVVESFLRPRITERAATVLRVAAEKFLTGVFNSALMVACDCRNATVVWPCDIEDAIKICGLDKVAGTCRPQAGCACAGLVSASTASTHPAPPDVTNSEEAQTAPAVVWRRRPMKWCEAAPLDGSSPQCAIRRSMRWIASRAGITHLAPGALDAASSALCAFLCTVIAKARGVGHPLLREAAESDSRVDRLVALVHTSCAAPLSSDDESAAESDESDREPWMTDDSDSDASDIRYAWEHTLRTRWTEAPGYELTESVLLRALAGLDYAVFSDRQPLSDMAAEYYNRCSRDVLGLLRDGVLDMEQFATDRGEGEGIDDRYFGLRLTMSSTQGPQDPVPERWCGAVGCPCPCCGRECLLWLVTYAGRAEVISVQPVVELEAVRVAERHAGERWTGCVYVDRDPPAAPSKLSMLPARQRPLRQGMGGADLTARAQRVLTETAARRAGFTHWAPEVEGLVGELVKKWGVEIAVLARGFHLHETSNREPRTIVYRQVAEDSIGTDELLMEEVQREISVAAYSGPLTFSNVARAVVTLLERTQKRLPVLYVRPFDAAADAAAALRAALPYAEPLLGPNEMGAVIELAEEFVGPVLPYPPTTVTFDTEANELMSRVFAHRLAWLFHRARPVSPVFDLPGGGRGPVLVPHVLSFIDSSGDNLAGFGPLGPRTGYH